jgi:hypothetical protein
MKGMDRCRLTLLLLLVALSAAGAAPPLLEGELVVPLRVLVFWALEEQRLVGAQ